MAVPTVGQKRQRRVAPDFSRGVSRRNGNAARKGTRIIDPARVGCENGAEITINAARGEPRTEPGLRHGRGMRVPVSVRIGWTSWQFIYTFERFCKKASPTNTPFSPVDPKKLAA